MTKRRIMKSRAGAPGSLDTSKSPAERDRLRALEAGDDYAEEERSENEYFQSGTFGFPNLEACCDGKLNPEMLKRFQLAMREYEVFMGGMRRLFATAKSATEN
jgi:hypothetical protein